VSRWFNDRYTYRYHCPSTLRTLGVTGLATFNGGPTIHGVTNIHGTGTRINTSGTDGNTAIGNASHYLMLTGNTIGINGAITVTGGFSDNTLTVTTGPSTFAGGVGITGGLTADTLTITTGPSTFAGGATINGGGHY